MVQKDAIDAKKLGVTLLGIGVFIAFIFAIRSSGLLEASIAPKVESGNVSSIDATWFLAVAESILSFAFTTAVFFFSRIGESSISLSKWMVGFTSSKKSTEGEPAGLDELIASLTKDAREKRTAVITKADIEAKTLIESKIRAAMEAIKNV